MQITPTLPAGTGTASGTLATQSDFQTFLNMLTVQMQNQDPLNPTNATDFAVQLATFSSVEQQTYTNQLLGAMLGRSGLADLGGWVGMEARIQGGAWFEGSPIDLTPDPALGADSVTLIVRDETGAIVDSRPLEPGTQAYRWDGIGADGRTLPDGTYRFEIESRLGDDLLDTQPVAAYLPIHEARQHEGQTVLVLPGGLWVPAESVSGLRRPPS